MQDKSGQTKDCEICPEFTELTILDNNNIDNMRLWSMIYDQQDVGMDGPTSLKVDVVLQVMDLIGIKKDKRLESLTIMKTCWTHFEYKARQERNREQEKLKNSDSVINSNTKLKDIKR